MGYFNFYIIKKIINSFFRYIKKNKTFIIFFIITVLFMYFFTLKSYGYTNYDIEKEIIDSQMYNQERFSYHCLYPYLGNTEYYQECIKPVLDDINGGHDFFIRYQNFSNRVEFHVYVYDYGNRTSTQNESYSSDIDNQTYQVYKGTFSSTQYRHYHIIWYNATNDGTMSLVNNTGSYSIPYCVINKQSPVFAELIRLIKTGGGDYSTLLGLINDNLTTMNTTSSDIYDMLDDLLQGLDAIEDNTSTDYSNAINAIEDKIDDLNDSVQDVNDSVQEVNDSVQDLKDTITDDTVESGASDLPSTNVNDPTQSGIDNIFQSIYDAFCTGTAQDIVFPIPFTESSITLNPYYVRDMLNNNNAGWVYDIIQAFWGYLIGRFIVYDIMKKISKIKSGNIEELETNNIKGDML